MAAKTETAYLCQCKFTNNPPFCDVSMLSRIGPVLPRRHSKSADAQSISFCPKGSHNGAAALKAYNRQLLQANSQLRDEVHTLKLQVGAPQIMG